MPLSDQDIFAFSLTVLARRPRRLIWVGAYSRLRGRSDQTSRCLDPAGHLGARERAGNFVHVPITDGNLKRGENNDLRLLLIFPDRRINAGIFGLLLPLIQKL